MGYLLWLNFMVMGLSVVWIRYFIIHPDKAVKAGTPNRVIKYKLLLWTIGVFAALNGFLGLFNLIRHSFSL